MKTALITGTTSGIGRALTAELAARKCRLVLVSRNADLLGAQREELKGCCGARVLTVPVDLADPAAVGDVVQAVRQAGWEVDVLINNAGFNVSGSLASSEPDRIRRMVSVNVQALTGLTQAFLPGMTARGWGRILNVGSTGAFMPCPEDAAYAATKAYVLSFSQALHQELRGTGVAVTCLCPGATETLFAAKAGLTASRLFGRGVMQPETVAACAVRGMLRGRPVVIAGVRNRFLVLFARMLPSAIAARAARHLLTERDRPV